MGKKKISGPEVPGQKYWQPVAESIDLEDRKLRLYVRHRHSLGTGRESILRNVLRQQTPAPFCIGSGFVTHLGEEPELSSQCDILVYDPTVSQPYYRSDDFVVAPFAAVALAIEVRSRLTIKNTKTSVCALEQMFRVAKSLRFGVPCGKPLFGLGHDGVGFNYFVKALKTRINEELVAAPACIACHSRNYIAVRILDDESTSSKIDIRGAFVAIDFGRKEHKGAATALFLGLYHSELGEQHPTIDGLRRAVGEFSLPDENLITIRENGTTSKGLNQMRTGNFV